MIAKTLPRILFICSLLIAALLWGYYAKRLHLFPSKELMLAEDQALDLQARLRGVAPLGHVNSNETHVVKVHDLTAMSPGLTLISGLDDRNGLMAKIVSPDGSVIKAWDLDWYKIYPDAKHIPTGKMPKAHPGAEVNGIAISPNGDITFNYGDLAMVQVDICGKVKWRLPVMTHHVVERAEDGSFWALDVNDRNKVDPRYPNLKPPYRDAGVIQVSNDGKLLQRFSIIDLYSRNGLQGLFAISGLDDAAAVYHDGLHANDVEVFPSTLKPGVFAPGDVMVSTRNNNTIFVFDPKTQVIKAVVSGVTVRQHDPDFIDGSTISIFDNNAVDDPPARQHSRIVEYNFATRAQRVLFEGTPAHHFYSFAMGRQQGLPNGNLLITEATRGRLLEVTPAGKVVWEYYNIVAPHELGELPEAERLSPKLFTVESIKAMTAACPKAA
ncbi:arylsulfotransferase family protein [soil metagenome]